MTVRVPPRASTRSFSPISPDPLLESAPPIPSSRIERWRLSPSASMRYLHLGGSGMFGRVGQCFGDDVIGADFD